MTTLYALTTDGTPDSTAMAETAVCDRHVSEIPPWLRSSFVDCTGNDALACNVCGRSRGGNEGHVDVLDATTCKHCRDALTYDGSEWFDSEGDRTCPTSPSDFHEPGDALVSDQGTACAQPRREVS